MIPISQKHSSLNILYTCGAIVISYFPFLRIPFHFGISTYLAFIIGLQKPFSVNVFEIINTVHINNFNLLTLKQICLEFKLRILSISEQLSLFFYIIKTTSHCMFVQLDRVLYSVRYMDCYYHSKQPLTNFCNNPLCSLPLCPKCINLHLSQSNLSHQLVPIGQAFSSSVEQLQTATRALEHEVQSIRVEYEPKNVAKDYAEMLGKYRRQAIDQINRHYDYLQRQILTQISNRYAHHLQSWIVPLQNLYADIQKYNQNIKRHDKSLQTLILVTSQQTILTVEDILLKIKDKKLEFKNELPKLQDCEAGKLKMAAQRIELYSYRQTPRVAPPLPSPNPALSGLDRIADLQARLHTLRYERCD